MNTQPSKMADNLAMLSELLSQFVMANRSRISREDFTEICAQLGLSQLERANLDSLFVSATDVAGSSSPRGRNEATITVLLALLNECASGKRMQAETSAAKTAASVQTTPPAGKLGLLLNELANADLFSQWKLQDDVDVRAFREYMRQLAGEEALSVPPLSRLPATTSSMNVKVLSQITMQHLITNVPRPCLVALVVLLDELRQCQLQLFTQASRLQKYAEHEESTSEKDSKILQLEESIREMKRKEVDFVDEIVRMKSTRQELEKEIKQLRTKLADLQTAKAHSLTRSAVTSSGSRKTANEEFVILPRLVPADSDKNDPVLPTNLANQTKKLLGELDAVRMKITQLNRQKSDSSNKHNHHVSDSVLDRQKFLSMLRPLRPNAKPITV